MSLRASLSQMRNPPLQWLARLLFRRVFTSQSFSPRSRFVSASGFGIRPPPDSGLVEARNTFAPPVTENSWKEEDSPHNWIKTT